VWFDSTRLSRGMLKRPGAAHISRHIISCVVFVR
jgi:hypothetical protein